MRLLSIILASLLCLPLIGSPTRKPQPPTSSPLATELHNILDVQKNAWNQGDIDKFMQAYWKSEFLTFSSGGKTTRGWQATRDRYRTRYPDKSSMGLLEFSSLETTQLGEAAALTLGKWRLEKEKPAEGNFSLVWQKLEGQWKIVHDHSSALPTDE